MTRRFAVHWLRLTHFDSVDKDLLEPGCSVLLHHKSSAIIGVLTDDTDPSVNV